MEKNDMVSFETLTALAEKLEAKRERLEHHLAEVLKDLDSVTNTLRLLRTNKLAPEAEPTFVEVPAELLTGKTIDEALVTIAEHNDGLLRVRFAKNLLVKLAIMAKKNAAASVYTSIGRSERWEKVDGGVYKLLASSPPSKLSIKVAEVIRTRDEVAAHTTANPTVVASGHTAAVEMESPTWIRRKISH